MTALLRRLILPLVVACGVVGCAGGSAVSADPELSVAQTHVVPGFVVAAGGKGASFALPAGRWAVSFDFVTAPGSELTVRAGAARLTLARLPGGTAPAFDGTTLLAPRVGWLDAGGSRHVEIAGGGGKPTVLAIDGRKLGPIARASGARLTFSAAGHGRARIAALIISPVAERGALLLHRLAELHARVPLGLYPGGSTLSDQIRYDHSWMQGFWPGALWQAAALEPAGGMFARWALSITERHFGAEAQDSHDVGFMYGQSSLAGFLALCGNPASEVLPDTVQLAKPQTCAALKRSADAAAGELVRLARSNPGSGTIPMNAVEQPADTIIDSLMNDALLPEVALPGEDAVARRHAEAVAHLLVRPDGSTFQAVYLNRQSGKVLSRGTHQGLSSDSTWSRGQAWAVYGFSVLGYLLDDPALIRVAQRTAAYVATHLPSAGIPLWDYNAQPTAPVDVSAGTITATGLLKLAAACRTFKSVCGAQRHKWIALSKRMLTAALDKTSTEPPFGLLRSQVLNFRGSGSGCWCNKGELIFGVSYALEGLRILNRPALTQGFPGP